MSKSPERQGSGSGELPSEAARLTDALVKGEKPTRKNHYLYQSKIDMAREILNVKTETEALNGALDLLIYGEALARGTEGMEGEEYQDVLGVGDEIPEPPPEE